MNDSKVKKSEKGRRVLVLTLFKIEIEGRGPYTCYEEVDLTKLDPRELIEDGDEDENSSEN